MKNFKDSTNYMWCTSFTLGKGATGTVYQGVDKRTGEQVAVKTLNPRSNLCPLMEAQMREFEVMRNLSHENIVKLYAIDEEVQSHKMVMILELCNSGSLFNVLQDPQNTYGLEEEQYICVLEAISAGMKYLRVQKIIHRDLKPGNIMHHITEDGCSVYKLADFGAARYLPADQEFLSIHGTEDYLHPDMYERAILRRPGIKPFKASVDLWSIGVTLYHVATGSLPFQPFGGKANVETKHFMTTKKDSGVISGVQHSRNGPIEWSKQLPKTCQLSQELQDLVTVLLAGILECSEEKMWTFDKFFDYTNDIISRKVFHVFYVNKAREIRLYMQPTKTLQDMKEKIFAQTGVPSSNQLLLFEKSLFISHIDSSSHISSFPSTTVDQPLILIDTENTDLNDLMRLDSLSACFPTLPSSVTVNSITDVAKTCCSIAYAIKQGIVKSVRCREFLLQIPETLVFLAKSTIEKLCSDSDILQEKIKDLHHRMDVLEKSYSFVSETVSTLSNGRDCRNELQGIALMIFELKNSVKQVEKNIAKSCSSVKNLVPVSEELKTEWKDILSGCSNHTGFNERADTYVRRVYDSWKVLSSDQIRVLSAFNLKMQELERVKLEQNSNKLNHLKEDCLNSCMHVSKKFVQWFGGMHDVTHKSHCLDEDLTSASNNFRNCISMLQKVESEICRISEMSVSLRKEAFKNRNLTQIQVLKQDNEDFSKFIIEQSRMMEELNELTSLLKSDMNNSKIKEPGKE